MGGSVPNGPAPKVAAHLRSISPPTAQTIRHVAATSKRNQVFDTMVPVFQSLWRLKPIKAEIKTALAKTINLVRT